MIGLNKCKSFAEPNVVLPVVVKKHKVLPELNAYWAALISIFLALSQTSVLHCETTDVRLVHCMMCLFMSQFLLILIAPTHRGMARLS